MSDPFKVLGFLSECRIRHASFEPTSKKLDSGSGTGGTVAVNRAEAAKVIAIRPRVASSVTSHSANKPSGQQVVARVVKDQVNRIFPQLSSAAREAMANDLRGILENDPRIQQLASEIS